MSIATITLDFVAIITCFIANAPAVAAYAITPV
jgi:hypothetical protein